LNVNKKIIRVLIVISTLFLALLSYLMFFNLFQAETVSTNPYNRRQWDEERYVTRGKIYDRTGKILAETIEGKDSVKRVYPEGRLYSHVIGYCSQVYGKSLLERQYDSELLGKGDIDLFQGDKKQGFDLNLTIDNNLQKYAYGQMNGKKGALVAMNPKTGEVLAMISLPDFEPDAEALEKNWNGIVEDESSPLLTRASQGLYPPGSTYKIVTAAASFENGLQGTNFEDTGSFKVGSLEVENYNKKAHGTITVEDAFRVSSNQVFCQLGFDLGSEIILGISERFGINSALEFDIPTAKSKIEYKKMSNSDSALVAIGQGQLLATPLQMVSVCSSVANNGRMVKPYLVSSVSKNNVILSETRTKTLGQPISADCAQYLENLMIDVVENGTGSRARISGVKVAGKTGTAENESDKDHAWFVGYAPADNPQIAVAVVLENDGGSGGDTAAPIAGNVIRKYLGM